ncbi:hypothetical protein N9955_00305 [bacterium]|nr:hypothetical protein [bacterium]
MNKNQILKTIQAYEKAEEYREKAEKKQDYWWDRKISAYEKLKSAINLKKGETMVVDDYVFYKEDSYPFALKIKKPKKL